MEMQSSDYPSSSLLQKEITQAAEFISKNPTFDGRDTVIAILDTGIDPAASGMQKTSTGKQKVIDFIDCSGSGDVELGPAQKCSDEKPFELVGDSERTLKLNPKWKNPSGNWYVGSKALYDFIPDEIVYELRNKRRQLFDKKLEKMRNVIYQKQQEQNNNDAKYDLDEQIKALDTLEDMYEDFGLILDCVVFHDGKQWLAAIDTEETGDLSQVSAMGAYKSTGDTGILCKQHLLYFTINFYDDGKILSIVTPSGSHGTHVAGIAAAYHPDEPSNIGIAPGAQLLSLNIGDDTVKVLETGIGITRAINALIEYNVDLANISFGEPTSQPNTGAWLNIVKEKVVNHSKCTFVSCGGNSGPALSTVTAPGGATDDIIGVGAYLSKDQMKANHSFLNPTRDHIFTWSSFGPAADGSRGVDIYAPGCATTSLPQYTKKKLEKYNGSSMASPYVCGSIALLISAWKQTYGITVKKISPYRIRNAILLTAKDFGHELSAGLIQVDAAWEFLKMHTDRKYEDVKLCVVNSDLDDMPGIYLRNACDSNVPRYFSLRVYPKFHQLSSTDIENDKDGSLTKEMNKFMYNYEQRILLKSTVPWVQVADSVYVNSNGNNFEVCVDATNLEAGLLHTGSILGYDSNDLERGPIFDYPVAVTKPLEVDSSASISFNDLEFKPTDFIRRFINVPIGATSAEITVNSPENPKDISPPGKIKMHLLQVLPDMRFNKYEYSIDCKAGNKTYISGKGASDQKISKNFSVVGNNTLELCVATMFTSQGNYSLDISIRFSGIVPMAAIAGNLDQPAIVLNGNRSVERIDLTALARHEYDLNPQISFNTLCKSLRPSAAKITCLSSERDAHPATGAASYTLNLEYKFSTISDYTFVKFRMPGIDYMIYENWADDYRLAIFNTDKQCIAKYVTYAGNQTLTKKGDYLIQVQIYHQNKQDLEQIQDVCLLAEIGINSIRLPWIRCKLSQIFSKSIYGQSNLYRVNMGSMAPLYINTQINGLPEEASPGDILIGKFKLADDSKCFGVEYIVPTKVGNISKYSSSSLSLSFASKANGGAADDTKETEEKEMLSLENQIRDLQITWIKQTESSNVRDKLVAELTKTAKTEDDKMAILMAYLESVDTYNRTVFPWSGNVGIDLDGANKVIEIADQIIEKTQSTALTASLYKGLNDNTASDEEIEAKKKAIMAKSYITKALVAKCYAAVFLAARNLFANEYIEAENIVHKQVYQKTLSQLLPWKDYQDSSSIENVVLNIALLVLEKKYAKALNQVILRIGKMPKLVSNVAERRALDDIFNKLLEKLGWTIWTDHFKARAKFTICRKY